MLPPYVHYIASQALALGVDHDRVTLYLVRLHESGKEPPPWMRAEMNRQDLVWVYTAISDILDMEDTATSVKFDLEPTPPAVSIVEPADGATVDPRFNLEVSWTNFKPSCDLEGKSNIWGVGHLHVFVDMMMAT